MTEIEQSLTDPHRALGMKQLNPLWAKAEIFLGLAAAAIGLMVARCINNRDPPCIPPAAVYTYREGVIS
jgi:hypothetical protein